MIDVLILIAYSAALLGLVAYSLHRGWLLATYRRTRRHCRRPTSWAGPLPRVTVQLPIFNERYVVERLIDAVCALDYPRDLLEVQVLDDSNDQTSELARERVQHHARRGVQIWHLRRGARKGYKAGALAYGLDRAHGELLLVLDADFLPPPDLLRRLVPPFGDPAVGMVQARWGHLNRNASWLTRAQALILDAHFLIEHGARSAAGLFFNFNGTAGMWRADCLRDAGGWEADTLTEDLDLSYRAQMRGWRFVFLPDVVVPGELPESVRAFKSQQTRWARGSVQTARKLLPLLLRGGWSWRVKLEAVAHLTAYIPSALTLALAVMVFPAAIVRLQGWPLLLLLDLVCFAAAIGPLCYFYAETLRADRRTAWPSILFYVPAILALGIGVSVNNSTALIAGLLKREEAEFVRTPKRGAARGAYRSHFSLWEAVVETALAGYVAIAVGYAMLNGLYPSVPFLLLFLGGFTAVAAGSMREPLGRAGITVSS